MATPAVAARYVTADFKHAPLIALADLMGLNAYEDEIVQNSELYAPILTGIVVHRHLPRHEQSKVNRAIHNDVPPSHLQTRLMDLISSQRAQPYWYMWSLSDEELKEFYSETSTTAEVTEQFSPLSPPNLTVAGVASAVFLTAKGGPRALASKMISSLKSSELVMAVGRRLGFGPQGVKTLGGIGVAALIAISVLNILAKKQSAQAKRELAARGLLAYEDL